MKQQQALAKSDLTSGEHKHKLFTYGTLQEPLVQEVVWGEQLDGNAAVLEGYARTGPIRIAPDVFDSVEGKVYTLTEEQLENTDEYEGEPVLYERKRALIKDIGAVWVYVPSQKEWW